jgi:multidrug resistance efflux pump
MHPDRIEQALARLEAALARAERAAHALDETPAVPRDEHAGLQQRHSQLKESVARSLRQLDEILAGVPQ